MIASFDCCITHAQIVVSWATADVELLWTDDHCAQGFVWSPTDVSFGVPDHDGLCRIDVARASDVVFNASRALWAVQVPFEVPSKDLAIGSIFDPKPIAIEPGRYCLVFAAYPGVTFGAGYAFRLLLLFRQDASAEFAILQRGDELTTDVVLRTDGEPI